MARSAASAPSVAPSVAMRSAGSAVHVAHAAPVRASGLVSTRTTVHSGVVTRVRFSNGVIHITRRSTTPARRVVQVPNQDFFDDTNAVPGLGFDYVHFAATHPNAFKHQRTNLGGFFPFFSGGFVFPSIPAVVEDETPETTEEVVADESPRRRVHIMVPEAAAPAVSASAESGPIAPSEEYVFVRRDGTVFFAVAYSWENGALRYITSQGLRGSVTREALDLGATQQFNEQRGLNFHSPA